MIAAVVAAAVGSAPGSGRPAVSLVASPARVSLVGAASRTVRVTNTGADPMIVDVAQAGFALDLHGRPRVVPRPGTGPAPWLAARPQRLALRPGRSASLTVSAALPAHAAPGDHTALVLLTTRPRSGGALSVRMRPGIVVSLRVPGPVVRRLVVRGVRLLRAHRGSTIEVSLANRGNVTEVVDGRRVTVLLRRRGHVLATLRPALRELLPRSRGIAEVRYAGRPRGALTAVVEFAPSAGGPTLRRSFPLRFPGRR